jgi:hypothetical protein
MQEQRDEGVVPMHSEDERLLLRYTIGERSCELRQRSVLLRWRAQRLRTRSTQLLHKHAGVALRVIPPVCPIVLRLQTSSHASQYPPQRGEGHVHWLYVGETLRRSAGPRVR